MNEFKMIRHDFRMPVDGVGMDVAAFYRPDVWSIYGEVIENYESSGFLPLRMADVVIAGDKVIKNRYDMTLADMVELGLCENEYNPLIEVI